MISVVTLANTSGMGAFYPNGLNGPINGARTRFWQQQIANAVCCELWRRRNETACLSCLALTLPWSLLVMAV